MSAQTWSNLLSGLFGAIVGSLVAIGYSVYVSGKSDRRKRRAIATGMLNEVGAVRDAVWSANDHLRLPTLNIQAQRLRIDWTNRFVEFAELFDSETVGLVHDFVGYVNHFNELAEAMRVCPDLAEARSIRRAQAVAIDLLLPASITLFDALSISSKHRPVGQRIIVDPKAQSVIPDRTGRIDPDDL